MDVSLSNALDAVAIPVGIAIPVFSDDELIDLELAWGNERLRSFGNFAEYLGKTATDVFPGLVAEGWLAEIQQIRTTGESLTKLRLPLRESGTAASSYRLVAKWHDDIVVLTVVVLSVDGYSNEHAVLTALNASRDGFAIWRALREETGQIATFILDYINEAGAAATQRPPLELQGLLIEEVLGGDQYLGLQALFTQAVDTHEVQISVVDVVSERGWDGAFENCVVPMGDDRVVAGFRDISEERREQNRLTWLAEHDHLTGAPNRVALERMLRETLQGARDRNRAAGFVFIDIDDFKNVNDRFGHEAGDKLLVHFVQRLQNAVDSLGEIARIAGDEFAIVLRNVQSMEQFDEVMRAVFQSMQRPFDYLSSDMFITVSAGGVLTRGHEDAFEVMRIADRVMYRVKHEGKNGFQRVDTAEL